MPKYRYFLSDFVQIQRESFRLFLQKGFINEFYKHTPIVNNKKTIEVLFYPEYYQLTIPDLTPREAILKGKSYSSKVFVPVQLTDRIHKKVFFQWCFLGNLPLMTKRGHFILNGAARVVINQILRSPGIYYRVSNVHTLTGLPKQTLETNQTPSKRSALTNTEGVRSLTTNPEGVRSLTTNPEGVRSLTTNPEGVRSLTNAQHLDSIEFDKNSQAQSDSSLSGYKDLTFKRYYADIVCVKGTWLRLEIDKDQMIWAQMKRVPKIPILWFLMAMGLTEKIILNSIIDSKRLLLNFFNASVANIPRLSVAKASNTQARLAALAKPSQVRDLAVSKADLSFKTRPWKGQQAQRACLVTYNSFSYYMEEFKQKYKYVQTPPEAWKEIYYLLSGSLKKGDTNSSNKVSSADLSLEGIDPAFTGVVTQPHPLTELSKPKRATKEVSSADLSLEVSSADLSLEVSSADLSLENKLDLKGEQTSRKQIKTKKNALAVFNGRKWIFNRFLNPKTYDLGSFGRYALNKKLGLSISKYQTTLTPQDVLKATDYLIKVEKGLKTTDDIDSLKNKRVRTTGELLELQTSISFLRLEKAILEKINNFTIATTKPHTNKTALAKPNSKQPQALPSIDLTNTETELIDKSLTSLLKGLVNSNVFNSALKEFFGTSPLSQFMDQINPLAEITHKRRLTSMGPGGVSRDNATMAIRGIHPTHYGRICPIETPEGKNTGLVNSITTFAVVNEYGIIETPYYKVYKGQVQQNLGMFYLTSENEEKIKVASPDLFISNVGFLPKSQNPVKVVDDFTKISRRAIDFIGVSPLQVISIATSLIPFLEHDDANRALMGSNMQRQAVPLIRPERPIVTTGLEARVISDSGQAIQAKKSGVVTFASSNKIIVFSI
uniref:RNA polymerase subunit beta 1 n=1 Tax=Leontynka pallida TaxID=2912034 RepID=UPI002028C204|nr:RNA polymerase subunit beta 1 [Leontynka pallida]UPQ43845.1 RNA polymerase subunit beta 1 [Leontynka pallida]